jgi:hypothetical protein
MRRRRAWRTAGVLGALGVAMCLAPPPAHGVVELATILISWGVPTLIAYGVSLAIVGGVLSGLSYGLQAALAPNPKTPTISSRVDGLRTILRNNAAPARIGYGRNKTSGVLIHVQSVDKNGNVVPQGPYLHFGLALAIGPICDIYNIELNDNEANTVAYSRRALFVPFLGYRDQPMLRGPLFLDQRIEMPARWLEKYRPLREIAWVHNVLKWDATVFPAGAPNVRYEWKGRPLYDPRLDVTRGGAHDLKDIRTWTYSNNPALCIRDWLTNRTYGRKVTDADVCEECLIAAANSCDELVEAPSSRTAANPSAMRPRYTCNGNWDAADKSIDVLGRLLSSCAGAAHFYDGQWHIKVGVARAVAVDGATGKPVIWSPKTMRAGGQFAILPRPGAKERVNTVRGLFVDPAANFQVNSFPDVTHADFQAADGNEEVVEEIELPFTQDVDEARALATILLKQARAGLRVQWPGMPMLLQHVPWQVVWVCLPFAGWGWQGLCQVTAATKTYAGTGIGSGRAAGDVICVEGCAASVNNGTKTIVAVPNADSLVVAESCVDQATATEVTLADKTFTILNRTQTETGAVDFLLAEYNDDQYVFALDPAQLPDATALPDPFKTGVPTNVVVSERTVVQPDGARIAALVVTWAPPVDGSAEAYRVRWRGVDASGLGATGTLWQEQIVSAPRTLLEISNLPEGAYEVAVASRLNVVFSADVTVAGVITYASLPPPNPINLRVQVDGAQRTYTWDVGGNGVEPPDLRGYYLLIVPGVVTDPVAAWDTPGLRPSFTSARHYETRRPTRPGTYTILVRAQDRTAMWSNGVASATVVIEPTEPDQVTMRAFSEEGWPGTIVNGAVSRRNAIEGAGDLTWADISTWAAVTTWGDGSRRPLIYTSEWIDLGRDMTVTATAVATTQRARGHRVEYAVRRDGEDRASPFRAGPLLIGRFVQVRCTLQPEPTTGGGTVALDELVVSIVERLTTATVNDYAMADRPVGLDAIARVERDASHWHQGAPLWRLGHVTNSDGSQSLTVDNDPLFDATASGGYVEIPDHPSLALTGPWTVECLGRINVTTGTAKPVLGKVGAWSVCWTAGSGLYFSTDGGTTALLGQYLPVNSKDVFHAAFVWTGIEWQGYVNGEQAFTVPASSLSVPSSANPLTLAKLGAATTDCLVGDVRVWGVARTPSDVAAWATSPVSPNTEGVRGQWRLNEVTGTTALDDVGGNHGTRYGSYARAYIMARESRPISLALMPLVYAPFVSWSGDMTGATESVVEASVDDGATWTAAVQDTWTIIPGLTGGQPPPAGGTLRVRQFLRATSASSRPTIRSVTSALAYLRSAGDLVMATPAALRDLHQVTVTAIQGGAGLTARLIVKDHVGARFQVTSAAGTPTDAIVDVFFHGGRA